MTDAESSLVHHIDYSPDGMALLGASSPVSMGFTGAYTDDNGLVYLHNRYYDPATGQFISQDPINGQVGGTSGRWNSYSYGLNNPVSNINPNGCFVFAPYLVAFAVGFAVDALM